MNPGLGAPALLWILVFGIPIVGLGAGGIESSSLAQHSPIFIGGNGAFTQENGVRDGRGTALDPYVIEGWDIDASSRVGIRIEHTDAHFVIRNVRVHSEQLRNGIELFDVSNGLIVNSTIDRNWHGISLAGVTNLALVENNISSSRFYGILVLSLDFAPYPSSNMTIMRNIVSRNLVGIAVYSSTDSSIVENEIIQNADLGISLYYCSRIHVYHNNIADNTFSGNNDPGLPDNQWDNDYPSGGNYWSDYSGVDYCSGPDQEVCNGPDGIGDSPYPLFEQSKDRYPLMTPRDTRFPVWPQGSSLTASSIRPTGFNLSWTPALDNVQVVGYRVHRDDSLLALVPGATTSYNVTGLAPETVYTFRVEAGDAAGHWTNSGPNNTIKTPVQTVPSRDPTPGPDRFEAPTLQFWQPALVLVAATAAAVSILVLVWAASRGKEIESSAS